MVKIGFSLQPQYTCPNSQVIELLREAGFSAVSPVYSPDLDLNTLANLATKNNMVIQSLHAPHKNIPYLWQPQEEISAETEKNIIKCINACAEYQIPIMVIHGWQGLIYTFPTAPLNFSAFDRIVEHAQEKNVCVAFENLEGEEYLEALLTRYKNISQVGFCFDTGHDHCYPHKLDFLKSFGERLIMTHINDNLGLRDKNGVPTGEDDLHFLPYDGNICWENTINRLKAAPKQDILNFEIKKRSSSNAEEDLIYQKLTDQEFFKTAGERAKKIAKLYEE